MKGPGGDSQIVDITVFRDSSLNIAKARKLNDARGSEKFRFVYAMKKLL
jgi:hypothetical protein